MRYMMMIYSQETGEALLPDHVQQLMNGHAAVMQDAGRKGVLVAAEKLKPSSTATSVRMNNGQAITTDGPFAETKEQLAGFYIIDCADLDEAIEWAKRIPTDCQGGKGCIEIRPVAEIPKQS